MYLSQLVNRVRWSAAILACFTMSFSPLASAIETEKISKTQIENYINASGLNKKTTWSQFYQNTKDYYPDDIAKKIEEFVKLNPDLPMPQVKLKSAQTSQGNETPVIELFDNGKTYTVQILGESDKWAKISGITLKESDLENPANGLIRLQTGNIFFKKDADAILAKHNLLPDQKAEEMKANLSLFQSFPRMTPQLWSSMTKSQRKQFIKQVADVWRAAETVLKTNSQPAKEKKSSLLENYLRFFLGSEAFATEGTVSGTDIAAPAGGVSGTDVVLPQDSAGGPSGTTVVSTQQRVIEQMERELSSNSALQESYRNGIWTQDLDRWFVQFEVSAERRAQEAINSCISRPSNFQSDDIKRAACEEFGRQLLINESVISQFRARACRAPAQYVGQYIRGESADARRQKDELNRRDINAAQDQLCQCNNPSARVKLNEACPAASTAAVQPAQPPVNPERQDPPARAGRSSGGGLSGFWPIALGGAAIGVLAGLLFFGKDKKKDRTTASASTAVAASCPANQIGTPPSCSCGPCTAPQQVYNFVTCQCTNVTTNVICPNNEMAPNGDSSKCQKCSDGTYKTTEPCPQAQPASCVGANCGGVRPAAIQ